MDNENFEARAPDQPADEQRKYDIRLPLLALGFIVISIGFIFIYDSTILYNLGIDLFLVVLPISGIITAIAALSKGKKVIGPVGKALAIVALVIPCSAIALLITVLIIFNYGASIGLVISM